MTLRQRIETDYITAYKAKEQVKLSVLRLLKTAAKNALVELRRSEADLDDTLLMDIILRQAKQREDSITQFRDAGRDDLADREAAELVILREYLPEALSEEAVHAAIEQAITATGATSPKEMGKVMQHIMDAHKGQVDGKQLSALVRARLGA